MQQISLDNSFDIKSLKVEVSNIYDEILDRKNLSLSLLRLDLTDSVISGNKIFKLYYYLQKAISSTQKIITFGGAYSNHLAATAAACRHYGIMCTGIVRGEKPVALSPTLSYCMQQEMQLEFITRSKYKEKSEAHFIKELQAKYGDHVLIPEGGFGNEGVQGAAEIYNYLPNDITHICCAAGTGTTIAGLIKASAPTQQITGFSCLKNFDFERNIIFLTGNPSLKNYRFINDYHFGGYGKKTHELISFMNSFHKKFMIPLDFVYTAKMMYGVLDLIKKNYFAKGSKIICIHTGGLQGNCSLQTGALNF